MPKRRRGKNPKNCRCIALNMNAVSHMATCGLMRPDTSRRWMPPRKNSSSLNPASTPTISIDMMRLLTESPPMSTLMVSPARSSASRIHVSMDASDDGSVSPSFHSIIMFIIGMEHIMVPTASTIGVILGIASTWRYSAGREV